MTDRELMQMALDALDMYREHDAENIGLADAAYEALRQALAQPEQEPVGYVTIETISSWAKVPSIKWFKKPTEGPLYTAPPKRDLTCVCGAVWDGEQMVHAPRKREWVGLTEDEKQFFKAMGFSGIDIVEAKLKEKNT